MKINKLFLEEIITSKKGILQIDIERLGRVIALVGKNGSGKTRCLDLFEQNFAEIITIYHFLDDSISNPPSIIQNTINKLLPYKEYLLIHKKLLDLNSKLDVYIGDKSFEQEVRKTQAEYNIQKSKLHTSLGRNANLGFQKIEKNLKIAEEIIKGIIPNYIRRIKHEDIQQLNEVLSDNSNKKVTSFDNLIENFSDKLKYNEIDSINKSSLNFLKQLPHKLAFDIMDCMGDENKSKKRISYIRYEKLKGLFKDFLNKDLTWERKTINKTLTDNGVQNTQSGIWKLDGRQFNYNELSDGEKTLLSYILLFFLIEQNPKLFIGESIIIIDEPELHLHPDSEIDLIKGLNKVISQKGQLIFATHSINILSNLQHDEIFMVKKGEIISPSRKTVSESLNELMNINDRIIKLNEFINHTSEWAYVNFMTQCLTEPNVVAHSQSDDPQYLSFKNAIIKNSNKKNNLLLDFGAGKGRLYELIKNDNNINLNYEYSALEPMKEYHPNLKSLGIENIVESYKELKKSTYDFIVLTNVLHEIPLKEWITTLNKIINALNESGYLLIIEDRLLPKGEKIGKIGYLVLDNDSIKVLFGLNKQPISFVEQSLSERILCSAIPKNKMKIINIETLIMSLKKLETNSYNKIKDLRKQDSIKNDLSLGRLNGFFSQQIINSKLAIEYLEEIRIHNKR